LGLIIKTTRVTTALQPPPPKPQGRPRSFNEHVRAAQMRASGMTWVAVAKELGISIQTLYHHMPELRPMVKQLRNGVAQLRKGGTAA
jgi:hypothetical protein